jgi:TonB family protein
MAAPPNFAPLQPEGDANTPAKSGYVPPGILAVAYPAYPIDAASVGAVVVQVEVNSDGKIENVKAIRAFPPFTQFCLDAAKKWQFRPAKLNDEPVKSNIGIAFVYSIPAISHE